MIVFFIFISFAFFQPQLADGVLAVVGNQTVLLSDVKDEADLISRENNTRGGLKDKDEKELIVFPYKLYLLLVATTVIPVVKLERDFLKIFLFIAFIHFFASKLSQSTCHF